MILTPDGARFHEIETGGAAPTPWPSAGPLARRFAPRLARLLPLDEPRVLVTP
jgi:hypothetical protein